LNPEKQQTFNQSKTSSSGMKKARDDASLALQKAAEDMKKYYDAHQ